MRRFGLLVLGVAVLIGGVVLYAASLPRPSFGWSAYAPRTATTFVVDPGPDLVPAAMGLIAAGLVLIAGWVGFQLGHRRRSPALDLFPALSNAKPAVCAATPTSDLSGRR